jgi:hypothetical protein
MSRELLFWVLMLLWLVFGLWADYVPGQPYPVRNGIGTVLLFVLFAVLGWQVFGAPVK